MKKLTQREEDVIRLLAEGNTRKQIAERLVIEINTVKTHLQNIYRKMRVGDREEAINLYLRSNNYCDIL